MVSDEIMICVCADYCCENVNVDPEVCVRCLIRMCSLHPGQVEMAVQALNQLLNLPKMPLVGLADGVSSTGVVSFHSIPNLSSRGM